MRSHRFPFGIVLFALGLVASTSEASARAAKPDFQGVWTNQSVTKLTRGAGDGPLVVDEAHARVMASSNPIAAYKRADVGVTDPRAPAPAAGEPGGYNGVYIEPGDTVARVKGEFRTSWLVDPVDGRLPFSPEGRRRLAAAQTFAKAADTPTDPESLEPWDRCLIASRGSGGPGMLNNIYNSNYQIVQTANALVIVVEMIHDPRIIPILPSKAQARAAHRPAALQPWLGDSVAWWEGSTLVVETLNVKSEQGRAGPIFLTPAARVTERFSRASATTLLYTFEVEDAAYYSRPWRAEMTLTSRPERLFEYACHEGNYALPNILRGARVREKASGS
ncbi:hypothetical protein BH09PSE2_BH09PSE2_24710 [soil metagenome]